MIEQRMLYNDDKRYTKTSRYELVSIPSNPERNISHFENFNDTFESMRARKVKRIGDSCYANVY